MRIVTDVGGEGRSLTGSVEWDLEEVVGDHLPDGTAPMWAAGFRMLREDLYVSRLARRIFGQGASSLVPQVPFVRDVLVTNMEYLLAT